MSNAIPIPKGTLVYVSSSVSEPCCPDYKRIYLSPSPSGRHLCVRGGYEGEYVDGDARAITEWNYVKPVKPLDNEKKEFTYGEMIR